jgi:DNA-binding CsgD family transcriptional regulator
MDLSNILQNHLIIKHLNKPLFDVDPGFGDLINVYFTHRERQVLYLIAEGKDNLEISKTLYLALGTVVNLVTNIRSKTNLPDRNKMILYAICWKRIHKDNPVKKPIVVVKKFCGIELFIVNNISLQILFAVFGI